MTMETKHTSCEKANHELNQLRLWIERFMRGGSTITETDIVGYAFNILSKYGDKLDDTIYNALKKVDGFVFYNNAKDCYEWEKMAQIEIKELNDVLIGYLD